jgi:fructose 1,6-bisphosphate aldolase/phosphatase
MFDDPGFDRARDQANEIMDYLRRHGPFEPHRLGLDEMEYTTMPSVGARLSDRWQSLDDLEAGEKAEPVATGVAARS